MWLKKLCVAILSGFLVMGMSTFPYTITSEPVSVSALTEKEAETKLKALMNKFKVSQQKTQEDKLDALVKAVASLEYNREYSSWVSMIEHGGGDCWGSTYMIIKMCELEGIEAWPRRANMDPGAGSGHMNAMAKIGDKYYECEAGYNEPAPRYYSVTPRENLWTTVNHDYSKKTAYIAQYDGQKDDISGTYTLPDKVGEYKIIGTKGTWVLRNQNKLTKLIIPEGYTSLDEGSLKDVGSNLSEVSIPSTMKTIKRLAFNANDKLTKFTVAPKNTVYSSEGGVLYNKAKTNLVSAPAVSSVKFPSTLKTIGGYAFKNNDNLKSISFPNTLTAIGEGAFAENNNLKNVYFNKAKVKIGSYAFYYTWGANFFGSNDIVSIGEDAFTSGTIIAPVNSKLYKYGKSKRIKCITPVYAPSNVKITASGGYINIKWSKVASTGAYKVYIKNSPTATFREVKRVNNKTFSAKIPAKEGSIYYVTVKAYNSIQQGAYKTYKVDTRKLPAPSVVNVSSSNGNITARWSKVSGAGRYQIYAKTSARGAYKLMKTVNNSTTSATFKAPAKGKIYVTVKAVTSTRQGYYKHYSVNVR